MHEWMSKRERMIAALSGKEADRIPVAPDISYMVPCKLTGKPFPEILLRQRPPVWQAYLDAVDYYDFDGWFMYGALSWKYDTPPEFSEKYTESVDSHGRIVITREIFTPKGDLRQRTVFPEYDCETCIEKVLKDFKKDFPKLRYLFPKVVGYDDALYQQQKKALGDRGMMGIGAYPPGFMNLFGYFNGNIEAMTYAYYDYPDLFEELCDLYAQDQLTKLSMILEIKPDSVLTGGSGSITMQSPDLFDQLTLPTLQKITRMCREAGVLSGVHSCGKEMHLIQRCAECTDLDYVNPLEIPPMGDCDLKTVKQLYGKKLALMGNLHTTNVMLNGTPTDVRRESIRAILDAGLGGGFVLSTGDQPGRDTPEVNIREMIATCKELGSYPLDVQALKAELKLLDTTS